VVVVSDSGTYGLGLAAGFSAALKKLGGRVRFNETVTPTNAKDIATKLSTQTPRVTRIVIATNDNTW
jgi:ABC-type branched-subunit amino acid transport system substrate-binding protein